ncbi:MAG: hypothetical protein FJW20_00790 [Acidimicrobiia bacterium]|nr:hypothetical protein [Acidimicrobiia bacterium]
MNGHNPLATQSAPAIPNPDTPGPRTKQADAGVMHIFFHGTFLFVIRRGEKRIEVLMPKVEDHVFRAGNWLGETQFGHAAHGGGGIPTYEIEGLEPGAALPDPKHNLIFADAPLNAKAGVHANLIVPMPAAIFTPRRAHVPEGDLDGKPPAGYQEHMATLQILSYRFKDDAKLRIKGNPGHAWEPAFSGPEGKSTVNLHVFASPDQDHGNSHTTTAFDRLMNLMSGVDLKITNRRSRSFLFPESLPDGIPPEESEDLTPRMARLGQMGRMRKSGRDLNLLWFPSEALDDKTSACTDCWNECS